MIKTSHTVCIGMMLMVLAGAVHPSLADCREIWIDQAVGVNSAGTQGTANDPFKSITYALAIARSQGWPGPWCVHIGPGIYDGDPAKPASEREAFPIVLGDGMVFEGTDRDTCIIDGQHYSTGDAALLYGNDLTGLAIRNLTLRNMNHSMGNGGAIELTECAGLLDHCSVENCSAKWSGGMQLTVRSAPPDRFDFISCRFSANRATEGGGGGLLTEPNTTGSLTDCTFNDNTAYGWGGGLAVAGALTGDINNCTFTNNLSGWHGGGGLCVLGNLTGQIQGCTFTGNSANDATYSGDRFGGGFLVGGTLNGNVSQCTFTSHVISARNTIRGGGFYAATLNGDVNDCTFSGNYLWDSYASSGSGSGGAGFFIQTLNGGVSGCRFENNHADGAGGNRHGGGFYVSGNVQNGVTDCTFVNNRADVNGGGFWALSVIGGVSNCEFTQNRASYYGGGFFCDDGLNGGVSNSIFEQNVVSSGDESGNGGGFCVDGPSPLSGDVAHCTFIANQSDANGSGFLAYNDLAGNVVDCQFLNNRPGGFVVGDTLTGDVRRCDFINDERLLGKRAILVWGAFVGTLETCQFFGFTVVDAQATVYLDNEEDATQTVTIRNNLFLAPPTLGGVSAWAVRSRQKMHVHNNTFIGPGPGTTSAASAVYCDFSTQADNSQVDHNIFAETTRAIDVGALVNMPIRYNAFYHLTDVVRLGGTGLGNDCGYPELILSNFRNNYCETDPRFVAWPAGTWTAGGTYDASAGESTFYNDAAGWPPAGLVGRFLEPDTADGVPLRALIVANAATTVTVLGNVAAYGEFGNPYQISDYHLSATSPCVDTGDPSFVPGDGETDVDGYPRVADGNHDGAAVVDRGACEMQDCNNNGIPDHDETDTDGDGIIDDCDRCPGFDDWLDEDGDGVPDGCDSCPGTVPGASVDEEGCPLPIPGDFNQDGDVDAGDRGVLESCSSGPAVPHSSSEICQDADFDHDKDVDQCDFGVFQCCYSGENNPADPACAE